MALPKMNSLRTRIVLLVLLTLTPAIILHVVAAMENRDRARRVAAKNLITHTELAASNIEARLRYAGEALQGLSLLPELQTMRPGVAVRTLSKALEVFPFFTELSLLDSQGHVVDAAPAQTGKAAKTDRPWLRQVLDGAPLGLGIDPAGAETAPPVLVLAWPIKGDDGGLRGMCSGRMRLDWFAHPFASERAPQGGLATLFDDQGVILATWPEKPHRLGQILPVADRRLPGTGSGRNHSVVTGAGPGDAPYLFVQDTVRIGAKGPLFLRVGFPKSTVTEPLDDSLRWDLALFALAVLLALFVAHRFSRAFLLRPIRQLARMARDMAAGDLDRRSGMGTGHGELSQLGAALDTMADALRERIRFTQEIIDAIPAPLFYKDRDCRYLGVNKTYEERVLPFAAIQGKQSADIYPEALAAHCDQTDQEVLCSPARAVQLESTFILRDGLRHDMLIFKSPFNNADGEMAGIVGVCLDITARKSFERALATSETRYRTLLASMRDGFAVFGANGRIMETNPAFCEMLGYDAGELSRLTDKDITPEGWHEAEKRLVRAEVDVRGFSDIFEKEYRRHDGTIIPVALRLHRYPVADEAGRRYFAIVRDISDAKAIEADLRQAKKDADTANQAKSAFLARMSHDIRTPLHAVIGMTELTLGTELSASQRDALETVRESAGSLLELINDILDISKIEAHKLELASECFDLRRLLAATIRTMRPQATHKGLALTLRLSPEVPQYVRGDHIRLRQILVNLVGNAIKFTQAGHVAVTARPLPENTMEFTVSDTGVGIAPDRVDRVFDVFTQAAPTVAGHYGGSGLGLAICRELTRLMGGSIDVTSTPGEGSVFRAVVPLPPGQLPVAAVAPAKRPSPSAISPCGALHILLVEDNPVNIKVASAYLRRRGHAFDVAVDGQEALDLLTVQSFDVVLMDLEMPGVDGLEATRRLRAGQAGPLNRDTPVIAMTAHALSDVRQRCLDAGMNDYVSKPLDFRGLDALLHRLAGAREEAVARAPLFEAPDLDTPRALQRLGGDTALLLELEKDFRRQYPRKLRLVALCRDNENWSEAALAAHSLKNIAGAVGAEKARVLSGLLETSLRQGDIEAAHETLDQLEAALHRCAKAMDTRRPLPVPPASAN